ncbi:MAG: pitrilysin family protein [Syntrophorhabdales bacterium]
MSKDRDDRVAGSGTGAKQNKLRGALLTVVARTLVLCLALLLLLGPVLQTEAKETGPEQSVLRATLQNGLRVVLVRNALAPVVTTMVNYLVGSVEAPSGFPGMAHAQEHMMFRGSPGLSADQLAGIIAAMGGKFNADTQQTVTQYFLTVPSADLDIALHIEAVRMRGVLDSDKLWAQERGAIEQEVAQDYSSPEFIFYTKLLAAMFKGTPYEESPLGSVSSFDKTTGEMLKKFYQTWYAPNNAVLVVVGDVEPEKALAEIRRHFERIPRKKIPERPAFHLEPVKPETMRLMTDEPYGLAIVAFRLPGYDSPDYPACRVLADALSNQRGMLFDLVPHGKALYAGFSLDTMPRAGLGYAMAAFPKETDPEGLLKEMRNILTDTLKKGLPTDLVEAAKKARRTKAELKKNSIQGLAQTWSEALTVEGKDSPEEAVRAIEKVSVDDVNGAARKYLDLEHSIITILTPESSGQAVAGKPHGPGVESFTPTQVKPVKFPAWAQKALKRLELPKSTVGPAVTILPSGLKIIVQPESVSDTVSVYGHVRSNADMEAPQGKKGVDEVLEQLFSYGTTTLDRIGFQKALDEIGAQESAGADFGLKVLADQFEKGVQLLADNELNPALPEGAFKIVRQQVAATAAGRLESPDYLAKKALATALFPKGDPALREATPESISSLSLDDVKNYYQKVFRPDLTTIVVMGKVTPDAARTVIDKYFGSWKATGPAPETFLPSVPPNRPSAATVPDRSRVQADVTLAQTLGLTRSNPDYYALELGNHVLGGAFYATRLFRDLREETGLVYTVASTFDVGVTRSIYGVTFGCDPQNEAKARAIVERDLKQMQTTPVTPEELERAKGLLLREIPLSESSIDQIAKKLIYLSTHFLPLDEPIRAARRYIDLSAAQVRAAYEKWLRPGDLVQVVKGPPPK